MKTKSSLKKNSRNQTILLYAKAAVHFYGVIDLPDFMLLINRYEKKNFSDKEILDYLKHYTLRKDAWVRLYGTLLSQKWFSEEVAQYFFQRQGDKPRYYPGKQKLQSFVKGNYMEMDRTQTAFENFLIQTEIVRPKHPYEILDDLYKLHDVALHGEKPSVFFDHIKKRHYVFHDERQLEIFGDFVFYLYNHTRNYLNKGHTATEISAHFAQPTNKTKKS